MRGQQNATQIEGVCERKF